ncbi:MAG: hypothetical protein KF866_09115 [Phycisphaeraceae bacterium]|nr:hypothetical protein [Phycisphaeraceae bacterium]
MVVLAEIGDKMPTFFSTLMDSIIVATIAVGIAHIRWWLALLAIPVFTLWNLAHYMELQEPGFGEQIVNELGYQYITNQFIAINSPALLGAVCVIWIRRSRSRLKDSALREDLDSA